MTFREILEYGRTILRENGIFEWEVDAWYLLEYITRMKKSSYYIRCNDEIPDLLSRKYQTVLEQRMRHIPLQYITGYQEFMGIEFKVTPDVLIPRLDTECLVVEVEQYLQKNMKVLDMCTGSGCISISLKSRNPEIEIFAADISASALDIAKFNAKKQKTPITFYLTNLFTDISGSFDVIVSNPPYIPTSEVNTLMPEVRDHEPRLALDGNEDGLEFYREIAKEARNYLLPSGRLYFEIGCTQADDVKELLEFYGYENIRIIKDLAGLDRIIYGGKKDV